MEALKWVAIVAAALGISTCIALLVGAAIRVGQRDPGPKKEE